MVAPAEQRDVVARELAVAEVASRARVSRDGPALGPRGGERRLERRAPGDGAAASNVKGPHKRKASSAEGVVDAGCWWGHGLAAARADSDDDDGAVVRRSTFKTPFSAARTERGAIAGDARSRCNICDGEFARDDVALLGGCNHHFCIPCVEIWSSRRARSCPTCKAPFDGWHYGEVVPCGADEDAAREMREAESRDEGAEEPKEPEPRADDGRAEENDDDETIGERVDRAKRRRMPSNE